LTNLEKAKFLRRVRKEMNLTQVQMAGILGLDDTYLSQFENDKRDISDWYVEKAQQALTEFEKSKSGNTTAATSEVRELPPMSETEVWRRRATVAETKLRDLRSGLRSLLDLSADVPLDPPASSTRASAAGSVLDAAEAAVEVDQESPRSPGAGGSSAPASLPLRAVSPESKGKP